MSPTSRSGIVAAVTAYTFWGFNPIYFKWLVAVPLMEITTQRVLWSIVFLAGFLYLRDGRRFWARLKVPARTLGGLALSGSLILLNWLVFVWAVEREQVLAASFGYLITPLVTVAVGVVVLREPITRLQVAAMLIAAAGTAYLGWYIGELPWIALILAFSFAGYGLLRKKLAAGPIVGLLWEMLLFAAPCLVYLAWVARSGNMVFAADDARLTALIPFLGFVTVFPLSLFHMAVKRLSFTLVGFLQYLGPAIGCFVAVVLFGEPFTPGYQVAIAAILFSAMILSAEPLFRAQRYRLPG